MSDRVEREIEEILRKVDDFPTEAARIRARRKERDREHRPGLLQRIGISFRGAGIGQVMLLSIVLVLGSHFIIGRFDSTVAQYGIILGLILFFSSFLLSFRPRGSTAPQVKRWRGRIIEPDTSSEPRPWSRLNRWWRRR
jgi:hypothetical protein